MKDERLDARGYIEKYLRIKTKRARIEKLRFNPAQARLYEALMEQDRAGKPMRAIVLKARQMGFSTLAEALIFWMAATEGNRNGLIVAHRQDSTRNLFEMSKRYYDHLPKDRRPMMKASNAQEILFDNPEKNAEKRAENPGLNSRIRCQTAGGGGIGRSDTLQMVHASEFAFWPGDKKDTFIGIMQAVPSESGTLVIVESTANGFDEFHELWEAAVNGESDFVPMFFPWFEMAEYRKPVPPGTEWTQAELEMRERYGLDDEQLQWRRWCIKNNCAGDVDKFRQEYPSYPEEAFLTSGSAVFDSDLVAARLQAVSEPVRIGRFEYDDDPQKPAEMVNIRFAEREDGCVRIYEEPEKGRPYVIGGDTAGTGSDWFTGQVLDNITGRQVAVLRHQYDEDQYAKQMYCLGRFYNDALIGIEVNYSTYPVKLLELMRYPRQYLRQRLDTLSGGYQDALGWETTSRTRPVAIAELVKGFREDPELVRDRQTLMEMRVFQYNADHRPEALPGEHDDLVMALCIANAIRGQQTMTLPGKKRATDGWTADMWEDYQNANAATKRELMRMWGVQSE